MVDDGGVTVNGALNTDRRAFEFMLIAIVLGMSAVAFQLGGYKLVVLNLFYLPIILSGYYLGRASACLLALLCTLAVTVVTAIDPAGLAAYFSPLLGGLSLAVWAAVLALVAILVGTLCDEREKTVDELHQAYVGVVEVLSKYLQGGNPRVKTRSVRVAELTQLVGQEMRLSRKQIDDMRVGALLYDLGNVQITTNLIARAVDRLESTGGSGGNHTFAGTDLAHSLGSVLQGAVPLLLCQDEDSSGLSDYSSEFRNPPLGSKIIQTVRAYDELAGGTQSDPKASPDNALRELRNDPSVTYDESILRALKRVVCADSSTSIPIPVNV